MSAENTVRIDGTSVVNVSGTVTTANTSATPLFVTQGTAPGQIYTTLIRNTLGVVAANNFLSLFNPLGSGKNVVVAQFVCFPYATAATSPTDNMEVWRTSAASAGTLLAAANIGKFNTSQSNSVAEVRTGNPTTTLVGTIPVLAIPPAVTSAAAGISSTINIIPPSGSLFICQPGEGVVARTPAGAVGQVWSLGFSWAEI